MYSPNFFLFYLWSNHCQISHNCTLVKISQSIKIFWKSLLSHDVMKTDELTCVYAGVI